MRNLLRCLLALGLSLCCFPVPLQAQRVTPSDVAGIAKALVARCANGQVLEKDTTAQAGVKCATPADLATPSQSGLAFYSTIPDNWADGDEFAPSLAGAGAGDLSAGVYSYKFTISAYDGELDTYSGETAAGTATPTVTVTNPAVDGQITVKLPTTCDEASGEKVNIYRTVANGSVYKLVASGRFACGKSYTDNVSDASLGATAPTINTTLHKRFTLLNSSIVPVLGDGFDDSVLNLGNPETSGGAVELVGTVSIHPDTSGDTLRLAAARGTNTGAGGALVLVGGDGGGATDFVSDSNGGNVRIGAGAGTGTGHDGDVFLTGRNVIVNNKTGVTKTTGCTITEITNGLITGTSGC